MILEGYQVKLVQVQESDLDMLRQWRNDPKVSQYMLTQEVISAEQQSAWFKKVSNDPRQLQFVILYKDIPIGAANLRAVNGNCIQTATIIEPGLYIYEDKYRANLLTFAPTLLLNDYSFYDIGVDTLRAVVRSDNKAALSYNEKLGYKVVKEGPLVEIELDKLRYEKASKALKGLLSRSSGGRR